MQIGFGMIFSILLIIAIISVSIYAIMYFIGLKDCANVGIFYKDIEERVDKAWVSTEVQEIFKGYVPRSVKKVCFGNPDIENYRDEDKEIYKHFGKYGLPEHNVFMYPDSGCESNLDSFNLAHVRIDEFFCVDNEDNIEIKIIKKSEDSLVTLTPK